jgi:glycogen synthase
VVVEGPCDDETPELLAERADAIKHVENPVRNLCISRNLGIDAAAGEIVAFIDDDGIPEPRWLEQLVAGYDGERVGGTGGLVYDQTGVNLQYRYAICDRVGRTDFNVTPPFDEYNRPGADPFVYLQGTNMSFRREALEQVGGFDEHIEYIWDESDLALHLLDEGWTLNPLDGAAVHHKLLPSHLRREQGVITDPYTPVKNRAYFALSNGVGKRPMEEVFRSLSDYLDLLRRWAEDSQRHGRFTAREAETFVTRMEEGFEAGVQIGIGGEPGRRVLAARNPDGFKPYPVLEPDGDRLQLCLVSLDYPPGPMGGIARYTADLARGIAAAGHDVHVVTRSQPPYRLDFEDGVWVHRYPEGERLLPALDAHPLRDNLAHCAAVWRAIDDADRRFGLDLVAGNVWIAEPLLSAIDARWPTVLTCSTPIRTIAATQPAVAAKPHTEWQARIEDAALVRAQHLIPVSHANLEMLRRLTPAAADVPATVVWHGMVDRAGVDRDQPPHDNGAVEVLFVGRLEPRKGIETLLEAVPELLRERPQALVRIAGADNPYAAEDPRSYAERLDARLAGDPALRRRIVFEGEVSDEQLDRLLASSDVFCAPSRYESFGLMNVEAMMFSRPVVSCRAGGIPEVIADGETGILVDVDDADGLKRALRRLVDDAELRTRMGAAGRERFEREFDNDVAVARTLEVFRSVLAGAPRADEGAFEAALVPLLAELEVGAPAQAAQQLLDPSAFPHDYTAPLSRLQNASSSEFVTGMFQAILRRDPRPDELRAATGSLDGGAYTRTQFVRETATGDEAKLLGVDASFLDKLGDHEPTELERRLRDAFWRDDETFARLVCEALPVPGVDPAALAAGLRSGEDRHAVLRAQLDRYDAGRKLPVGSALAAAEYLTVEQLSERLAALAALDGEAFVGAAYRLLLGREPDAAGAAGYRAALAHGTRKDVIVSIASSAEAQRRGIDPVVIDTAAGRLPQLSPPPGRRERARRLARRVLRDPQVATLREELERQTAESRRAADDVAALVASQEAVRRLETELRGLSADLGRFDVRVGGQLAVVADRLGGLERRTAVHGTYLADGRILISTTWGGKLLTPAHDLSLTPELVAHGVYEPPFTNFLMRRLEPGMTVVDVGANIGLHTILMASWVGPEGRVIAYEPNPDVAGLLRENVALNWFNDRVSVRELAASDRAGALRFHVTERFMGNSSLLEHGESYFREAPMDSTRTIEVQAEPLDALADSLPRAIDLVKIDAEGGEPLVLAGMARALDRGAVDAVSLELYRERNGAQWETLCGLLRARADGGWRFHTIRDDGELEAADLEDLLAVGRFAQVVMTRP